MLKKHVVWRAFVDNWIRMAKAYGMGASPFDQAPLSAHKPLKGVPWARYTVRQATQTEMPLGKPAWDNCFMSVSREVRKIMVRAYCTCSCLALV